MGASPILGVPTLAPLIVPGASRYLDLSWPVLVGGARITGTFPGTGATARNTGSTIAGAISQTSGGTGVQSSTVYKNQLAGSLVNVAGPDLSGMGWSSAIIYPFLDKLSTDWTAPYPLVVWRYLWLMAFPNIPGSIPAGADIGCLICTSNQTTLNGTRPGVLFGPRDNNTIGLGVRKVAAGAYTVDVTQTLAQCGIADLTNFNLFELRIINGNAQRGALLKAFINGGQFGPSIDCSAAAGLFPVIDAGGGGFDGFRSSAAIQALGFAYTMHVASTHFIISATED